MITIKLNSNEAGNDEVIVETDATDSEALAQFDKIFEIMVGERERRGGYMNSSKFIVEVRNE